jgi:RNA polymerase sigma factor (sigma-70 family)
MYKIPEEEVDRMQERLYRLTGRQREILDHVLEGSTNEEIATILGISRRTVETHRLRVMAALGAHNTAELVGKVVWFRAREHFLERAAI